MWDKTNLYFVSTLHAHWRPTFVPHSSIHVSMILRYIFFPSSTFCGWIVCCVFLFFSFNVHLNTLLCFMRFYTVSHSCMVCVTSRKAEQPNMIKYFYENARIKWVLYMCLCMSALWFELLLLLSQPVQLLSTLWLNANRKLFTVNSCCFAVE